MLLKGLKGNRRRGFNSLAFQLKARSYFSGLMLLFFPLPSISLIPSKRESFLRHLKKINKSNIQCSQATSSSGWLIDRISCSLSLFFYLSHSLSLPCLFFLLRCIDLLIFQAFFVLMARRHLEELPPGLSRPLNELINFPT